MYSHAAISKLKYLYILCFLVLLGACQPVVEEANILVSLIIDGRQLDYQISDVVTVEEFLRQVEIELGEQDRINPPRFTQITDGLRITVVRVSEETECETETIPFERRFVRSEGIPPGEERLTQPGVNGERQICYRVMIEDGQRRSRTPINETIIKEAQAEVVYIGTTEEPEPVTIGGTLAYINNGNAWVIKGNSINKRNLTTDGTLDSLVFSLSPDGRYLIFTSKASEDDSFFNQLWLIETANDSAPIPLAPADVLHADWVPNTPNTISYSTGEKQSSAPFWKAFNNLSNLTIDPQTGRTLRIDPLVEESSFGLYSWWGTLFQWSPDGTQLAWARADAMGLVDLETGDMNISLQYAVVRTTQPWSWRAAISWSWDNRLLATTVHGAPLGTEEPENSPVFNVTVVDSAGNFNATLVESAGMWAAPRFSPQVNAPDSQFPQSYLAFLRARRPFSSRTGEYDLVIADRDGSNARVIFPDKDLPGITTKDFGLAPQDFTWSPDGKQIAVIYNGNLWVVDVQSAVAFQLTFDGNTENPVWSQ